MNWSDKGACYSFIIKCLHWSVALTIIIQIIIGLVVTHIHDHPLISNLFFIHKSLGLTLLLLDIIFVLWRFCHHRPAHHHSAMPAWQHISDKIVHLALFALIIIIPLRAG